MIYIASSLIVPGIISSPMPFLQNKITKKERRRAFLSTTFETEEDKDLSEESIVYVDFEFQSRLILFGIFQDSSEDVSPTFVP